MDKTNFFWGTATSAYQIEGAHDKDGKVPSIWDKLSHRVNYVTNGHTGDDACNHYYLWESDVKLMKKLGVNAYRFSISWSRIMSHSCQELPYPYANKKGIEFYQKLITKLLRNGIEPFVTLYHWDLPKWANDMGGWDNPKMVDEFIAYTELLCQFLPEVKHWITFNEPAVFVNNYWGHSHFSKAVKNVLLAHGYAVKVIRKKIKDAEIGISLNLIPMMPANELVKADVKAADIADKKHNRLWLDPLFKGGFPDGINELYHLKEPLHLSEKEKKVVSTPLDFLGINYYTLAVIKSLGGGKYKSVSGPAPEDDMGTPINPYGLYNISMRVHDDYNINSIYITENGCAYSDGLVHDKIVTDTRRIKYIRHHLAFVKKAIEDQIPIKGYFYWSFLDNFEWTFGYTKRFGLVHVHYPTSERIPKESFDWYHKIITDKKFRNYELSWDVINEKEDRQ